MLVSSLFLFTSSASAAQLVTLSKFGSVGNTNPPGGGPFTATVMSGPLVGPEFITFCLEINEHIGLNQPCHYELSTAVKCRGGSVPIALSNDTAYLYSNFRSMNLTSFAGTSDYTTRASLIALQEAIWAIEGYSILLSGTSQALYNVAVAADWSDLGNVRVMNIGNVVGNYSKQNQLAIVPIPAAAWLFGSALLGLVGISCRKRSVSPFGAERTGSLTLLGLLRCCDANGGLTLE